LPSPDLSPRERDSDGEVTLRAFLKTGLKLDKIRSKVIKNHNVKLNKDAVIKLSCDYCKGPVHGKPSILKFASFERFFCCPSCKTLYKEKHKGRIQSLSEKLKYI